MSAATIDRLLKAEKAKYARRRNSGTKPGSILKSQIPIRTGNDDIDQPGCLEADTVAHCGGSMRGSFIRSITYTDITTGSTAQRSVWNKGYAGVLEQTEDVEKKLPFPIPGFNTDNGGEFLNGHLVRCFKGREHPVGFTRSRSCHKNDNAHVEQKNWTRVRELPGYDRFENPNRTTQKGATSCVDFHNNPYVHGLPVQFHRLILYWPRPGPRVFDEPKNLIEGHSALVTNGPNHAGDNLFS